MKIGLLTFHNTTNIGATLQNYALQTKVLSLGGDCYTINYHCDNIEYRESVIFPYYKKSLRYWLAQIKKYIAMYSKRRTQNKFVKKYIRLLGDYNKKTSYLIEDDFDKIIVGSDMVWDLDITEGDFTYYLDCVKDNKKKYSYAACIGIDDIADEFKERFKKCLSEFNMLSVREIQGAMLIKDIANVEAKVVLDPTLLLTADEWGLLAESSRVKPNKFIVLYFISLNSLIYEVVKKIAKENECDIVYIGDGLFFRNKTDCHVINGASINEWLYYIKNAFLVVTASYHGMILSMNFNTNFFYYNRANSSRMESIAKLTGMESRRITEQLVPEIECDFSVANEKLSILRKDSIDFLQKIIDD